MLSFQHGPNWVESIKTPNTPTYLKIYTPPKLPSERRWRIVDEVTGEIVDSYTPPPPPKRPKPITNYIGSWAHKLALQQLPA
jgi:hypothetical protein